MSVSVQLDRSGSRFDAALLDRDGTLVRDVPYNGDPDRVEPMPGAAEAVARLRDAGLRLGVVSNQSGIGRGLLDAAAVARVNARIDELLGPFETWQVCPHTHEDQCRCRKPAPGLIREAARALGTTPQRCVVIGDIGADVDAAAAAGATGLLVPTEATRAAEVAQAPAVVASLGDAVDWILARESLLHPPVPAAPSGGNVLAVRADSTGDVLICGPAIRALAARAARVTLLCGPRGRAAAGLLPGIDDIIEWPVPWIDSAAGPVDPAAVTALLTEVSLRGIDEAVIFTSYHQSALPLALLLRLAGVGRVSAISDDYAGGLLDVRHRVPPGVPEPERALSLAAAAGYPLPDGADGGLRVNTDLSARTYPDPEEEEDPGDDIDNSGSGGGGGGGGSGDGTVRDGAGYVLVHPGASVPARACPPERCAEIVAALTAAGRRVVVTGGPDERELTAQVAGDVASDRGGDYDLAGLARLIAGADALVSGNTGPAHLAAAVGTPVVSLFAPTVPFGQWAPYQVPTVRLGEQLAACRETRAVRCPVPGHPCLSRIDPADVVAAVDALVGGTR
uniref:HAD-IIIA family hydrolase n=1 Tax=Rugosimonospora africana TaxID=556532 RepID=UPI0019407003|nr:HAD-IIIA family hydrolase [Rugosimonospora africana]